ncbi:MAG TPA: hypothetical protein PK939_11745, partial [Bacteroidales bacterium]|nr:hypothetical protein [Bacteroidales bacterium]
PLSIFLFRTFQQMFIFWKSAKSLHEKFSFFLVPFGELFFIIFNPVIFLVNSVSKPIKWM